MSERLNILNQKYNELFLKYNNINDNLSSIRLFQFFFFLVMLFISNSFSNIKTIGLVICGLILLSFLIICIYHNNISVKVNKYKYFLIVIKKYKDRINNDWKNFEDTGSDLVDDNNSFLYDLDIVGKNSLFQYLNIAKSNGGRLNLLEKLSNKLISKDDLNKRQDSISELTTELSFCIEFQQIINEENKISDDLQEKVIALEKETASHKTELIVGIIFSFITIILLLLSMLEIINMAYFLGMAVLQLCSSLIYCMIYKKEFEIVGKSARTLGNLYNIFNFLANSKFNSAQLKSIIINIKKGRKSIKEFNSVADLDTLRYKFLSYVLINSILPLNIYILYKFNKIKSRTPGIIKKCIVDFEELESLVSLSTIGVAKTNICMPTINDNIELNMEDIKHPLLTEKQSINNSFSCKDNVVIITGSNMSGKTTFMRTIGINLILMNAGTFVNSKSFSAPYLKIFTSMRIKDDIDQGISTFYGELLRIKDIIDYQKRNLPTIAFIDEIFKGTNYNDRMFGAKEVIKKLSNPNVILFITTHDFELCDIKNKKVINYYFQEYYDKENINFDYKIKKGKCNTTNAKYLMAKLNII